MAILLKANEQGKVNIEELNQYISIVEQNYAKTKELHPYSMILGYNLARVAILKNDLKSAIKYLDEIKEISEHYKTWPDTQTWLTKASDLRKQVEQKLEQNK